MRAYEQGVGRINRKCISGTITVDYDLTSLFQSEAVLASFIEGKILSKSPAQSSIQKNTSQKK